MPFGTVAMCFGSFFVTLSALRASVSLVTNRVYLRQSGRVYVSASTASGWYMVIGVRCVSIIYSRRSIPFEPSESISSKIASLTLLGTLRCKPGIGWTTVSSR